MLFYLDYFTKVGFKFKIANRGFRMTLKIPLKKIRMEQIYIIAFISETDPNSGKISNSYRPSQDTKKIE